MIRHVHTAIFVRPEGEFVSRGDLYDYERGIKLKRVVDLRPPID